MANQAVYVSNVYGVDVLREDSCIKKKRLGMEMFSGRKSSNRDSVATAAGVVREAIVLMSVHEERANVRRSIQAETAEASSLLLFSTNLSDKEQWERQQQRQTGHHSGAE